MSMLLARRRLVEADDTYLDRVAKYVPIEVVAAYLAINRLFLVTDPNRGPFVTLEVAFGLCWLATPLYVWRLAQVSPPKRWKAHAVVSSIAFPIWGFAIGGLLFKDWADQPTLPSVLLILFSLFAGLIPPEKT